MSFPKRPIIGSVAAVATLAAAGALGASLGASQSAKEGQDLLSRVQSESSGVHDKLALRLREVESRVSAAASLSQVRALSSTPVDAATLEDSFGSETWWKPFRDDYPVYQLDMGDGRRRFVVGVPPGTLQDAELLAEARKKRLASAFLATGGKVYAAAAAVVETPPRPGAQPALVVLAKPLDKSALEPPAGTAIALTDGNTVLLAAGDQSAREAFGANIGAEKEGSRLGPNNAWGAHAVPLSPRVWMWLIRLGTGSGGAGAALFIWIVAALLAIAFLVLGFRKTKVVEDEATRQLLSQTSARLAEAEERISQLMQTPPQTGAISDLSQTMTRAQPAVTPHPSPAAAASAQQPVIAPPNAADPYGSTHFGPTPPSGVSGLAQFGRYTLLEKLGEGGMAEVFTAATFGAEGFKRVFVVKRMRAELSRDKNAVAQFIDEARLGSTLVHSNIIPVFDFGKVGEEYFLASEFILGRDLDKLVSRHQEIFGAALPADEVFFVAHETLKALAYAHSKTDEQGSPLGLVHRDVSPNNIMVSARGEVKLFDFGIVKAEGRVSKTAHGMVKGNPYFMSPEQARGMPVDGRSDLFTLALVLYYCLTGEPLYKPGNPMQVLMQAASGPNEEQWQKVVALGDDVARVLVKAMRFEREERFENAEAFEAAVAPMKANSPKSLVVKIRELFGTEFETFEADLAAAMPSEQPSSDEVPPQAAAPVPSGTKMWGEET